MWRHDNDLPLLHHNLDIDISELFTLKLINNQGSQFQIV